MCRGGGGEAEAQAAEVGRTVYSRHGHSIDNKKVRHSGTFLQWWWPREVIPLMWVPRGGNAADRHLASRSSEEGAGVELL